MGGGPGPGAPPPPLDPPLRTHGLYEELGRHKDREGKIECSLGGAEYESVVNVLWECPCYCSSTLISLGNLQEIDILT